MHHDRYNTTLLCDFCSAPDPVLPDELTQDVLVLDEPLPTVEDLTRILDDTIAAANVPELESDANGKAVDALLGLAAFPAEQVLPMSLLKKGLDLEQLWERKRQVIEQTPGLSGWRGGETFADIGGCENIKRFLTAVIKGEEAPRGSYREHGAEDRLRSWGHEKLAGPVRPVSVCRPRSRLWML